MQPRQIVRTTSFGPDALGIIFRAFDGAWSEIAPRIGTEATTVESARTLLAIIVLGLANADTITAEGLRTMAVAVFCAKYRMHPDDACQMQISRRDVARSGDPSAAQSVSS